MSSPRIGTARQGLIPLAGLVLAGLAAALAFVHWSGAENGNRGGSRGSGGAKDRPVPVLAEAVHTGDIKVYLTGLGTVTPRNRVTVRTQVDGQLMQVAFEEGQMVQAGELLAQIDPRPYQVQLLQAQGALARDQALLDNARVDLKRYKTLYHQDSGSQQQWETQRALVEQYEAAIKTDQAQIESAQLQLTYCRITAPVGGRVGLRQVDPGNIVHTSDANGLVVITELQPIFVVFTLPADDLPAVLKQIRASEKLPVEVYDRDQRTLLATGFLLTLDNQIDTATGTIRLKAEFANNDEGLFPNQFVNARLLVRTLHDATLAPTAAVQRGVPGTYVYVVGANRTVSVRPVKLGPTEGDLAAVKSGLEAGELVVVDGADKLREGAKVDLGRRKGRAVTAKATGVTLEKEQQGRAHDNRQLRSAQ
ncbi:MAG: MdtA/MuxA family multidrug efflux RND transporter periplasmic adaptor subunit [Chromatiaceae bacterium]|jgi:membrane fusion protein, multidrug efflux system